MLEFQYFDAAGAVDGNGVFIPVGDLPGLEGAELALAATGKESKTVLALWNTLYDIVGAANFDKLGWTLTKGNPASAGTDLINQSYAIGITYYGDHGNNTLGQIPVATIGTSADVGKIGLQDIFPNVEKIADAGNTPGAGIFVPAASVEAYGAPLHAALTIDVGEDNRDYLAAVVNWMATNATLRSANDASAITTRSRGNSVSVAPAAALTDATNPTSGILAADLDKTSLFSISYGVTVQLLLNQETQTFDVNSVTS